MAEESPTKARSRRHFDRWAGRYERDPASRWLATIQSAALDALELGRTDRLLDVGCGTGAAVRRAAPLTERAVGLDLSRMLDRLLRALQPSHVGFYRSAELASMLSDAGLSPRRPRHLWSGGYVLMPARKGRVDAPAAALS